jgi:ketosteroid isomerase-like protein
MGDYHVGNYQSRREEEMLKNMRVTVLMIAIVTAACFVGMVQAGDLVAELQAMADKYSKTIVDGDYETMLKLYADDVTVMPNYGKKLEGKEAVHKNMMADREKGIVFESFTARVEKAWECGGKVYEIGTYALSVSIPELPRPVADKGKYLTIYKREKSGKLKVVFEIWNTDVEPGK